MKEKASKSEERWEDSRNDGCLSEVQERKQDERHQNTWSQTPAKPLSTLPLRNQESGILGSPAITGVEIRMQVISTADTVHLSYTSLPPVMQYWSKGIKGTSVVSKTRSGCLWKYVKGNSNAVKSQINSKFKEFMTNRISEPVHSRKNIKLFQEETFVAAKISNRYCKITLK